jgi:hypothetical protein
MRVFAYCAETFAEATAKAAGVAPLTCPPADAGGFDPAQLAGRDLLYFDLHGHPGVGTWYGDGELPALTAAQLRAANLAGACVFATNCYLADADSPMLAALLSAGARCVVAGPGENFAGTRTVFGAGLLGEAFRLLLAAGFDPELALSGAKALIRIDATLGSAVHKAAVPDTLGFKVITHLERN